MANGKPPPHESERVYSDRASPSNLLQLSSPRGESVFVRVFLHSDRLEVIHMYITHPRDSHCMHKRNRPGRRMPDHLSRLGKQL